jgi:sarcosine oxidase subunit beta
MSSNRAWDVVIAGAGSVGTPAAMYLAGMGMSVLCVDPEASAGQGSNKCAIGGIRATHSEPAKVRLCLESLRVFSTWRETHGDDIGWVRGGYTYVAYDEKTEALLEAMLPKQKAAGLDIDWVDADAIRRIVPGIRSDGLRGGTWSPGDGSASPMSSCYAFCRRARESGAEFRFRERVTGLETSGSRITAVVTDRGRHPCGTFLNCAGAEARRVGSMAGMDIPVFPDLHEGGVTEPVRSFFTPMVVDIRKAPGSANYYFYQHETGQVVFCITPDPPILGTSRDETSEFLPQVAGRMVGLYPRLANLKVRRTWRGCYPQTPDGSPIVGRSGPENSWVAVGMCGQGFMLGPGVGSLVSRAVAGGISGDDEMVLSALRADRPWSSQEALK